MRWIRRTRDWLKAARNRQRTNDRRLSPRGRKPWALGYADHRRKTLASSLERRERCCEQFRFRIAAAIRARSDDYRRATAAVGRQKSSGKVGRDDRVRAALRRREAQEARHAKREAGLRKALFLAAGRAS